MARTQQYKDFHTSPPDRPSAKTTYRGQRAPSFPEAKSANLTARKYRSSWKYPPEFWDGLSKIPLISPALEELNRRNRAKPVCSYLSPPTGLTRDLIQFASQGGPDLSNLRGYSTLASIKRQDMSVMGPSAQMQGSRSNDASTATSRISKKSSPYNPGFDQHLIDHGIHTTWKSQKIDLDEVRAALIVPRPSLALSNFSEGAFEAFQETNAQAKDGRDVLYDVLPSITGPPKDNYPSAKSVVFGNLEPLTDGSIVAPTPDIALGAVPEQLNPTIRLSLQHHIMPSAMTDRAMAPNFFVEAKGPDGSAAVMIRQARYDGAVGSRAMHSLQNYGQEEPVYDNQIYTYSSTYHNGQLQLYAHHTTAPPTSNGRPEYHINQLRAFGMTDARETFVQGATAYRNLRDLAKRHRDTFIQDANARYQAELP